MNIHHKPVLLNYLLENLDIKGGVVFDGTLGEGGHSLAFLQNGCTVYACDRDEHILNKAKQRLSEYHQFHPFHAHSKDMPHFLSKDISFDLMLFDLGISVYHYKEASRGFSFMDNSPLDMRLDTSKPLSAYNIINEYAEEEMANIFYQYGEERLSRRIARKIVNMRQQSPIETSLELANIIQSVKPKTGKIHPATQIFQALRIVVNEELDHLETIISNSLPYLKPGGKIAIITYHSLEDRIIKNAFKNLVDRRFNFNKYRDDITNISEYELFNKKVIEAEPEEVMENHAARSAKMRLLQRKRYGGRHERESKKN